MPYRSQDLTFRSPKENSFGLIRCNNTPKPSFVAYVVLAQTIDNLPYAGRLSLDTITYKNCAAIVFSDSNNLKTVIAFWNAGNKLIRYAFTLPDCNKYSIDLFGTRAAFTGPMYEVQFSKSPIYMVLEGVSLRTLRWHLTDTPDKRRTSSNWLSGLFNTSSICNNRIDE